MKKALLILHGFAGDVRHYDELKEYFKSYSDVDIFTFVMPGHETGFVCKAKATDYLKESELQLQTIIDKGYDDITILGHSMGGAIATYLGAEFEEISRLIIMAPAYSVLDHKDSIYNDPKTLKLAKSRNGKSIKELAYFFKHFPPKSIREFYKMIKLCYGTIGLVDKPALYLHGDLDYVTPRYKSREAYEKNRSKNKTYIVVDGATHEIYKSEYEKFIYELTHKFIIGEEIPTGYYNSVSEFEIMLNNKRK